MKHKLTTIQVLFWAMVITIASCNKDKSGNSAKPTISSFTLSTFNFNVSNYTNLKAVIDGVETGISGSSWTATGLTPNKYYTITLIATNQNGSVSSAQNFTTLKSSLAITNYKVVDSSENGATFNFAANSNATITSQSLTNNVIGEVIDVTGKTDHSVSNLNPNTSYTFTFKVKDNTGNEVSSNITFKTKEKKSNWISFTDIEYANPFAIIGNAVSNKLTVKVLNTAGGVKVLPSFKVNFGPNAKAVKMLRYSLNGSSWVMVNPDNANEFTFNNTTLIPGENVFEIYFSLKVNVGVADNAPLSFTITNMNDGEGATLPSDGSFPASVSVGNVNASIQPTVIVNEWRGYMFSAPAAVSPNTVGYLGIYQIINVKMSGPTGAKFKSIRFKNPYTAFNGLVFGYQNSWKYGLSDGAGKEVKSFSWQGEYADVILPDEAIIITNGITPNDFYFRPFLKNGGSEVFYSGAPEFTPGKMGFYVTSKYDIVLLNAAGQVIDLSDVRVYHEDVLLN